MDGQKRHEMGGGGALFSMGWSLYRDGQCHDRGRQAVEGGRQAVQWEPFSAARLPSCSLLRKKRGEKKKEERHLELKALTATRMSSWSR